MVAADEAIGVSVHAFGGAGGAAVDDHRDAAREPRGVVAERDGLADERGSDFEDDAVEADGAIVLDLAFSSKRKSAVRSCVGSVTWGGGPSETGARGCLSLWRKRSGVDEGHAEFGADEREMAGAIGGAIVDVLCPVRICGGLRRSTLTSCDAQRKVGT